MRCMSSSTECGDEWQAGWLFESVCICEWEEDGSRPKWRPVASPRFDKEVEECNRLLLTKGRYD